MLREIVNAMWDEGWFGRLLLALIILMVSLIPLLIWAEIEEDRQWEIFSAAHECKVVGRMSGSMQSGAGFGVAANGQVGTVITTTSIPSKIGWLCNDGVTYWR